MGNKICKVDIYYFHVLTLNVSCQITSKFLSYSFHVHSLNVVPFNLSFPESVHLSFKYILFIWTL